MDLKKLDLSVAFVLAFFFVLISIPTLACGTTPSSISSDYARIFVQDKEIRFKIDTQETIASARPVPVPADRDTCLTTATIVYPKIIPNCYPTNSPTCEYPNYTGTPLSVNSSTSPEWLFIENSTGRMVQIAEVLPIDDKGKPTEETPSSYLTNSIWYRVSVDGGVTFNLFKPMIQPGYNLTNRFPGVFPGTNGMQSGASHLIQMSNGEIVVPVSYWPLDSSNNPTTTQFSTSNGVAYHGASFGVGAVLIGKWNTNYTDLTWTISQRVFLPESLSTRGIVESTVAELKSHPGTLVMISRGSNELAPSIPGRRWVSKSIDFGRTWSNPIPLCYGDGTCFYSSSSTSNLIRAQNGRLYWIGNITDTNPDGNSPRYPLYMAEVDEESLVLIRGSIIQIDNKTDRDSPAFQLADFRTYLDVSTVLIYLNRNDGADMTGPKNWYSLGFAYGH